MCISKNTAVVNVGGRKLDGLLSIGLQLYIMSLQTQLVEYRISIYIQMLKKNLPVSKVPLLTQQYQSPQRSAEKWLFEEKVDVSTYIRTCFCHLSTDRSI